MISNTLKFKAGNRIGSNPILSELIRSCWNELTLRIIPTKLILRVS